ncbi:allantoinase [Folsomia candida]|nr:allantoinase [Folsomia candida]
MSCSSTKIPDVETNIHWLTGNRIFINGGLKPASIKIENGKISEVKEGPLSDKFENVLDAGELVVMPGLVDTHVHVNEPGRSEWEGFWTATQAAAAGGITTLVDMPLNSIPSTTTVENLDIKMKAATGKCHIDVGFWGGVMPDNENSLRPMVEKGVIGFKCFLIHSGIDDFPSVNEEQVDRALAELKGTGKILAFHAEVDCGGDEKWATDDPSVYRTFLQTRPSEMEFQAAEMINRMCRKHKDVKCHIVHLSTASSLPLIAKLKADGLPLTVETCPHYLTLNAEEIQNNRTEFKCCPPIREADNQSKLWEGIKSGLIDMIVSDHSPCTADLKQPGEKNFQQAWGGISSVQFGLPLIWTNMKKNGLQLHDLCRLMAEHPAKLAGFEKIKAKIAVGFDADFVLWNPDEEFEITENIILHKNKLTPYKGKTYSGRVHSTILRGKVIYNNGKFATPNGKFLLTEMKL